MIATINYIKKTYCLILVLLVTTISYSGETLQIKVENSINGAPITMGIPFPKGVLGCPDEVRVLDKKGNEIPSQTNLVTTWEPLDYSVKWLWVFFFSTGDSEYILEYGDGVEKASIKGPQIKIKNAQRTGQNSYVETGPLQFTISKKGGGFIDDVLFDVGKDGFDGGDTIAVANDSRGSFLDILDDLGIDQSRATVHRTVRERGSGPLHAIIRLEGNYTYEREDNRDSPFIIRIHLYAGKSYIRVFHTLTYTGVPDKHTERTGEHANIALMDGELKDDSKSTDKGWMQANDQISGVGLSLNYNLSGEIDFKCGYKEGSWFENKEAQIFNTSNVQNKNISVFQTGPKPDRIPPVPNSTTKNRISGFEAEVSIDNKSKLKVDRAEGWSNISDARWGIGIGIKNFLEEYPKEIAFDTEKGLAVAYLWSPKAGPMSFARSSTDRDQGMISNFAEGVTKTSEVVIHFHKSNLSTEELKQTMDYFLDPPVPHASPETYSKSMVYGQFSPKQKDFPEFERALEYKFDWELFNQHWEPWYGMFDYGDQKNSFYRDDWHRWQNNEPAIDFMYWLQFMRTGDPKYHQAAEAMSRHTMDVDNIHWPTDQRYHGDTNESVDYWKWKDKQPKASPYLGIGRRHADQHWSANLSAHVWLEGWLASYYLTGYHRGLDIAKLTADSYTRRIWGEHGLTGRRLYLSVWNMVEAWDATKDPVYLKDLKERVDNMIKFQNGSEQYDNLVIDRYGYSQVYASHGLYKYYQLTGDEKVKQALLRHARAVRDNPPYNHEYESYLATIHSLLVGYEFTKDHGFLDEAKKRAEVLKSDKLKVPFDELNNQEEIAQALRDISNLPPKGNFGKARWIANWDATQGLRVFGWTHIYSVPWLLKWLREEELKTNAKTHNKK